MTVFSPQQWTVLLALQRYRFLTVPQLLRLGVSNSANALRDKTLFALRHHGYIQSEKLGSHLPNVHALTPKGAAIVAEMEGIEPTNAPHAKRQPFSALFAQHRAAQVECHIGICQWVERRGDLEILLELQDFVRQPRAATELTVPGLVNSVIPDGLFAVRTPKGKNALYVIEVHRATQSKAVAEQLSHYFEVIRSGVIAQTHHIEAHPIICSIHHQDSVLRSVKTRLCAHEAFVPFRQNFVFNRLANLTDDFTTGWHLADDTPADPFPMRNPNPDDPAS